jgi:hypothetical protein
LPESSRASCVRGRGLWHRVVGGWEQRALEGSPASGWFATRAGTDLTVACGFLLPSAAFFLLPVDMSVFIFFLKKIATSRFFRNKDL